MRYHNVLDFKLMHHPGLEPRTLSPAYIICECLSGRELIQPLDKGEDSKQSQIQRCRVEHVLRPRPHTPVCLIVALLLSALY
jgi:hypothetical protein